MKTTTQLGTVATVLLFATPALALTITNQGKDEHTVGIDRGAVEEVLVIPGGKSVSVSDCSEGCGVTGPWDFSKFKKTGDKVFFDGKSMRYK